MKTLLTILLAGLLAASCSIRKYAERAYVLDYKDHDHPGFLVSPSPIDNNNEALAEIRVEFICGKIKNVADTAGLVPFTAGSPSSGIVLHSPTYRRMLNRCIEEAQKHGADALFSFRVSYDPATLTYTASGTAARRIARPRPALE